MKHTLELDDMELAALYDTLRRSQSEIMVESRLNWGQSKKLPDREEVLLNLVLILKLYSMTQHIRTWIHL